MISKPLDHWFVFLIFLKALEINGLIITIRTQKQYKVGLFTWSFSLSLALLREKGSRTGRKSSRYTMAIFPEETETQPPDVQGHARSDGNLPLKDATSFLTTQALSPSTTSTPSPCPHGVTGLLPHPLCPSNPTWLQSHSPHPRSLATSPTLNLLQTAVTHSEQRLVHSQLSVSEPFIPPPLSVRETQRWGRRVQRPHTSRAPFHVAH